MRNILTTPQNSAINPRKSGFRQMKTLQNQSIFVILGRFYEKKGFFLVILSHISLTPPQKGQTINLVVFFSFEIYLH